MMIIDRIVALRLYVSRITFPVFRFPMMEEP
jgi:hypothetical protein